MTRAARMEAAYQDAREDQIQASIVEYIRLCHPDCIVAHVPNGGLRAKREAARLKWQGVLAGYPDLIVNIPGGKAILLEVKAPKGVLSDNQKALRDHCERFEIPWAVVKSVDEARDALAKWGLIGREVPSGPEGGATPPEPTKPSPENEQ